MTAKLPETAVNPADLLRAGARDLGLILGEATVRQFLFYADELLQWNARINLTGLKSVPEIVVKHFLDSLAVWPWVRDLTSLADIGAGAGFPGLPLKLALPHLRLTLIEPTGKKAAFLQFVAAHLNLRDVIVRPVHLTPALAREWGPLGDGAVTRATFPLARYLALAAPLVKAGGRVLALKGPSLGSGEWQEAVAQAPRNHCQPPARHDYALPQSGERRVLVVWEKGLPIPPGLKG